MEKTFSLLTSHPTVPPRVTYAIHKMSRCFNLNSEKSLCACTQCCYQCLIFDTKLQKCPRQVRLFFGCESV